MKGLYKIAPGGGNLELRDGPVPTPAPGQVLIEIKTAGLCGSDIHIYHWSINFAMRPPMIIGHEFSGEIVEIGEGVTGWKIGDRVTAEPCTIVCGVCRYCRVGAFNLCAQRRVMGYWVNGIFAEYVTIEAGRLHKLPDAISFDEGALTEPLACCVHAVHELTGVEIADTVVITGPGAIGLLCLQLAKLEGAQVVMVGTSQDTDRLKIAKKLGADYCMNAETEDVPAAVGELTDGNGADIVFECSGAGPAAGLGLDSVRKQGKYTQVGLFGKPITVDFEKIAYKELHVTGSLAQQWTSWKRTIKIMDQGKLDLKAVISEKLPLSQWKEAFERFEAKKGLKILFDPKR